MWRIKLLVAGSMLSSVWGGSAAADTVFEAIGGQPALTSIADKLLDRAVVDPRIADKFSNINVERLKHRLALYLCTVSGGSCHFHGISMKGAHGYLELTDVHFNALVEDLQKAMDDADVPFRTQNRLLALLAPTRRDIVTR